MFMARFVATAGIVVMTVAALIVVPSLYQQFSRGR